jgi:death-on-curing protein
MKGLTPEDIRFFHDIVLATSGGTPGVLNIAPIESAVARTKQPYYSSLFQKAAALAEELVKSHPFTDGNKRTALLSIATLLFKNGYDLTLEKEATVSIFCRLADCQLRWSGLADWIETNSRCLLP